MRLRLRRASMWQWAGPRRLRAPKALRLRPTWRIQWPPPDTGSRARGFRCAAAAKRASNPFVRETVALVWTKSLQRKLWPSPMMTKSLPSIHIVPGQSGSDLCVDGLEHIATTPKLLTLDPPRWTIGLRGRGNDFALGCLRGLQKGAHARRPDPQ
uniref:Uncharacterized protein n=1 Tax=Mycena chlorophos TaxID=658473 RepID=A0ABQ0LQ33_MYCCL|nr:predicted protein [Mycena chlorophos]